MIDQASTITVAWIPLATIRFDDQPIDQAQVRFYTALLTGHDGHLAPPILNEDMTIRDGRHRLLAHRAAGRDQARCLIVQGQHRVNKIQCSPEHPPGVCRPGTDQRVD